MKDIDRVANLLYQAIKDRQNLTIGTAIAAAQQGQTSSYSTAIGNIKAIATNFCYGQCLLFKIDGTWYALKPQGNEIVRSIQERLFWRRPKRQIRDLFEGAVAGINDFAANPRKIVYDLDIEILPTSGTLPLGLFLNIYPSGGDTSDDLSELYWQVAAIDVLSVIKNFYWLDKTGTEIRYNINTSEYAAFDNYVYIGAGIFFALFSQNFFDPIDFPLGRSPLMRFYQPSGIVAQLTQIQSIALETPPPNILAIYPNIVPPTANIARSTLLDYSRHVASPLGYVNTPNGEPIGSLTGILNLSYETDLQFNCKLPLLIGQKVLSLIMDTPVLKLRTAIDSRYSNWNPGLLSGTLVERTIYRYFNDKLSTLRYPHELGNPARQYQGDTTKIYDIDGLAVGFNQYNNPQIFTTSYQVAGNIITFLGAGIGSHSLSIAIAETITQNSTGTNSVKTYAPNGLWDDVFAIKFAIIGSDILNCKFDNLTTANLTQTIDPEKYTLQSAPYTINSTFPNDSDLAGLVFFEAEFFNPIYSILVGSIDCYAKIWRTMSFSGNPKIYVLEFWISDTGTVELHGVKERITTAEEVPPQQARSILYYPPTEDE